MPKTALYNMEGAAIGEIELSDELFGAEINVAAMHLVVRSILANKRQGTQSARPARKCAAAAARSIAKRVPATPGTMATAHRSSPTAAWCSLPSPVIM